MTDPLEYCAELVAYACDGKSVPVAYTYKAVDRVWLTSRDIKNAASRRARDTIGSHSDPDMPPSFGSVMLQRAAKAGLIAERSHQQPWKGARVERRFTTLELAEAWDAELGLSDGERAERTVAAVRYLYRENIVQRGDSVGRWPVSADLMAVPQDGIDPAIEAGILVEHRDYNGSRRLVPAEHWDVFQESLANLRLREAQANERHAELIARLHRYAGGNVDNLQRMTSGQLEQVLAAIEP